jgi:hypothetical protein
MLALAGRHNDRIDFGPCDDFVVIRGGKLGADVLRELLRGVEIGVRDGDEVNRRMRRREFGAQRADATGADDGEPDVPAFDGVLLIRSSDSAS